MKKLQLRSLNLNPGDILSREELRSVQGSGLGSGSGGYCFDPGCQGKVAGAGCLTSGGGTGSCLVFMCNASPSYTYLQCIP